MNTLNAIGRVFILGSGFLTVDQVGLTDFGFFVEVVSIDTD